MIWMGFLAFLFLAIRLGVVIANLFSRPFLREAGKDRDLLVSVLIPARNEEKNLPGLIDGLLEQQYQNLEIWIFDDDSTDRTGEIIEAYRKRDGRIRAIRGRELPDGWNGKNNACHQLSLRAGGEYLLFLDADVKVGPDLVARALAHARKHDLTLLTIFPRQQMESWGERLSVPIMNWILLGMLPLRLVRTSHYPSLAAANGQFMLFRGREYRQHRFHSLVRDINVEDIHIARRIKRMGYKAETLLGRADVSCRMYQTWRESIFGFTRNMFAFFGGSGPALLLYTILTTFGVFFVWLGFSLYHSLVYLLIAMWFRILVTYLSRQPLVLITLLSPLIQVTFVWIVIQSFILRHRGENRWKGRIIQFRGI